MRHEILIRADGESSASLRGLIERDLPEGVRLQAVRPQRGGFAAPDPQTLSLVVQSVTAVVTSLIAVIGAVWAARITASARTNPTSAATVPVMIISTQTADIRVALYPDALVALAEASVPDEMHQIIEIRLEAARESAP